MKVSARSSVNVKLLFVSVFPTFWMWCLDVFQYLFKMCSYHGLHALWSWFQCVLVSLGPNWNRTVHLPDIRARLLLLHLARISECESELQQHHHVSCHHHLQPELFQVRLDVQIGEIKVMFPKLVQIYKLSTNLNSICWEILKLSRKQQRSTA